MSELVEVIKGWPVIIQGALGSALFWLVLVLAQKLFEISANNFSKRSKEQRISWLISRMAKFEAFGDENDDARSAFATSVLVYRSLRHAYKGFLWLGLGLLVFTFDEIGLAIGGIGLTYHFLKAYDVISPFKDEENTSEERQRVRDELAKLDH